LCGLGFGDRVVLIQSLPQLALGLVPKHLLAYDPDRGDALVQEFLARLENAQTHQDMGPWLDVLGNSGASEAFAAVEDRLQNHGESVREHAILALGYMEVEGVDALLAEILKEEPLAALRLQAAIAFECREMTMANLQAQILALQRDPVKKI